MNNLDKEDIIELINYFSDKVQEFNNGETRIPLRYEHRYKKLKIQLLIDKDE